MMSSRAEMDGALGKRQARGGILGQYSHIISHAPWRQQADKWPPPSFYLTKTFLLGIAAIFVLMIAAAEALNYFSARDLGIAQVAEQQHYLWTYGPTLCMASMKLAL
jgi:hypothetical protein